RPIEASRENFVASAERRCKFGSRRPISQSRHCRVSVLSGRSRDGFAEQATLHSRHGIDATFFGHRNPIGWPHCRLTSAQLTCLIEVEQGQAGGGAPDE